MFHDVGSWAETASYQLTRQCRQGAGGRDVRAGLKLEGLRAAVGARAARKLRRFTVEGRVAATNTGTSALLLQLLRSTAQRAGIDAFAALRHSKQLSTRSSACLKLSPRLREHHARCAHVSSPSEFAFAQNTVYHVPFCQMSRSGDVLQFAAGRMPYSHAAGHLKVGAPPSAAPSRRAAPATGSERRGWASGRSQWPTCC